MDLTLLITYWGIIALLATVPGADWAYLIASGLRGRGTPAVLGMVAGHLAIAVATALGLAALVGAHPWVSVIIGVCGGLVLLKLGASALTGVLEERRGRRTAAEVVAATAAELDSQPAEFRAGTGRVAVQERTVTRPSAVATFVQGASVSLLNPKVYLLFLTLVPQFVSASSPLSDTTQLLVLGLIHVATCAMLYLGVAHGAGALLLSRPRAATAVTAASGLVMIVLGLVVIVEPLLHLG
ncbi:MAG TPA: LysE family translocator [Candidatus Brevibacterium intestinigallinarum]|nr:LysE family translocator [Candidatus Brevibacterium intestinigallinarum]